MENWVNEIQAKYPGSLFNTNRLCEYFNNPQKNFKCIHITGTNGKGSVTKKCSEVLMASGFTVGMYISPHILHYTERIQVKMQAISIPDFLKYSELVKAASESLEMNIGWFDLYTIICFLYFSDNNVEWACIEVGLGGRLDNTNVVTSDISIIVSVGLDHIEILGNTIDQIAQEKAGIIKPNTVCVYGPTVPDHIIQPVCKALSSTAIKVEMTTEYYTFNEENTKIAETALKVLQAQGVKIPESAFVGLNSAQPFRMYEVRVNGNHIIIDVAHNPPGILKLLSDIDHKYTRSVNITAVIGMSKGKMIKECLDIACARVNSLYLVTGDSYRLAGLEELQRCASGRVCGAGNVTDVLQQLVHQRLEGVLLITGSFYLMPEVYTYLKPLINGN